MALGRLEALSETIGQSHRRRASRGSERHWRIHPEEDQRTAHYGQAGLLRELKAATPPGLVAMLDIPGLGPKKIS